MPSAYSIRTSLQGELQDFLRVGGFVNCTPTSDLVRDLTALLAAYREEDVPLYPSVFVLSSVDQLAELAPGTERVVIGSRILGELVASAILKDCAPLAVNGWSIFVGKSIDGTIFQYGLFRSLANTYATSADEAMVQDSSNSAILMIRNRGHLVVELRNARDEVFTASLTSAMATESHFAVHVSTLAEAVGADLNPDTKQAFIPYVRRFLGDILQRCHGALCAVMRPPNDQIVPQQFAKSVWLVEPLRLASAHTDAILQKSADSLAQLQALESLLVGMINSDGVVLLGSNGTVLGYRAFLSPTEEERKHPEVEGGGRRRTYELMKGRLNGELRAAFFRSQDGATACERANQ